MNLLLKSSAAATAFAIPVGCAADEPKLAVDPIFAVIERHCQLRRALDEVIERRCALEKELPRDKRQTSITCFGEKTVHTDDPRWIAAEWAVHATFDWAFEAAVQLTDVQPTTLAGVSTLLRYSAELEAQDMIGAPDTLEDDDDPLVHKENGAPFSYFIRRNAADAIDEIAALA